MVQQEKFCSQTSFGYKNLCRAENQWSYILYVARSIADVVVDFLYKKIMLAKGEYKLVCFNLLGGAALPAACQLLSPQQFFTSALSMEAIRLIDKCSASLNSCQCDHHAVKKIKIITR